MSLIGKKTLWEYDKFLVDSIFPFSQIVLMSLKQSSFKNIVEKGENASDKHFLLFKLCFLSNQRLKSFFSNINLSSAKAFNLVSVKILSFESKFVV